MFKIEFEDSGSAFDWRDEYSRILRSIADKIDMHHSNGIIMDINGNKVGEWTMNDEIETFIVSSWTSDEDGPIIVKYETTSGYHGYENVSDYPMNIKAKIKPLVGSGMSVFLTSALLEVEYERASVLFSRDYVSNIQQMPALSFKEYLEAEVEKYDISDYIYISDDCDVEINLLAITQFLF